MEVYIVSGIILSKTNRKTTPSRKPTAAGTHAIFPCSSAISMEGIIKDQIDAAIITPEAKPNKSFSTLLFILFFNFFNCIPQYFTNFFLFYLFCYIIQPY